MVRNSLAVLDVSILFQDFFVTFLLHWTYAFVPEVLRLITVNFIRLRFRKLEVNKTVKWYKIP